MSRCILLMIFSLVVDFKLWENIYYSYSKFLPLPLNLMYNVYVLALKYESVVMGRALSLE